MAATRYSTDVTIGGRALVADGTNALPALSFEADPDTGIYRSAANTLNISTGGTSRFALSATALTTTLPLRGQNGTAAAPALSFSGDTNTGIYSAGADALGLSAGGTVRLTVGTAAIAVNSLPITGVADPTNPQDAATKSYVDSAVSGGVTFPLLAPLGDASAPSYSFATQTGTGVYATATGMGVAAFGQAAGRFDAAGLVLPDGDAVTPSLTFENGAGAGLFTTLGLVGIAAGGQAVAYFGPGGVVIGGKRILNVGDPVDSADAATKGYVDTGFTRAIQQVTDSTQTGPSQGAVFITSTVGGHVFSSNKWYRVTIQVAGAAQLANTGWNFTLRNTGGALLTGASTYIHRASHTSSETIIMTFYFVGGGSAHGIRCQWNQRDGNNSTFTSYGNSITTTMMVEGPL